MKGEAETPHQTRAAPHLQPRVFVAAALTGVLFGAADQYLGSRVMVGDPFALGPWATAMVLGLTATLAALAGYFAMMWSPLEGVSVTWALTRLPTLLGSQWLNIVGGMVTAPLFGLLGQRWRVDRSLLSVALVAGSLGLEPLARLLAGRLLSPAFVWELEAAAGIVLGMSLLLARASHAHRVV